MAARRQRAEPGETGGYDVIHARILYRFPELVTELGGDFQAICRRAGLPEGYHLRRGDPVTYRDFVYLLETAAQELACPDFGMRLAARQNGAGSFGPLGQVMRHSRNFGEALAYVSRHPQAHSLAARVWLRRLPREGRVFAGHDILLHGLSGREQAIEQLMLAGHLAAMELTAGQARARVVHFRHEPVSGLRTYRRYFGCEVRFGQPADGVTFADADLAAPIVAADERALREITAAIERRFKRRQPPLHAQVRAVMLRQLATGNSSNQQVAGALCMHLRTLHRRLRDEGTHFQALKDEVRRDLLRYYLQRTDLALGSISERLGYAEQSVMSRSCRRWFGVPPATLRQQR